jgi:hypothetical protein
MQRNAQQMRLNDRLRTSFRKLLYQNPHLETRIAGHHLVASSIVGEHIARHADA